MRNTERKELAEQRNEKWRKLSYTQQLAILKNRPGECKKQIKKIKMKMNEGTP